MNNRNERFTIFGFNPATGRTTERIGTCTGYDAQDALNNYPNKFGNVKVGMTILVVPDVANVTGPAVFKAEHRLPVRPPLAYRAVSS